MNARKLVFSLAALMTSGWGISHQTAPPTRQLPKGANTALLKSPRKCEIKLSSLHVLKTSDPLGDDEPYLVGYGFSIKAGQKIKPSDVHVIQIGKSNHGGLKHPGDDFGAEGHRYAISGEDFDATVPAEPGWVVGAVYAFLEEDESTEEIIMEFNHKLSSALAQALQKINTSELVAGSSAGMFLDSTWLELINPILSVSPVMLVNGLFSTANPDDYGGVQCVLMMSFPKDQVKFYAGPLQRGLKNVLFQEMKVGPSSRAFRLDFPVGDLGGIRFNAQYGGRCVFGGTVSKSN